MCYDVEFEVNKNPLEKADRTVDDLTGSLVKMGDAGQKGGKKVEDSFKKTNDEAKKLKKGVGEAFGEAGRLSNMLKGAFAGLAGSAIVKGIQSMAMGAYNLADGFANVEYAAAKVNTLAKQDLPTVLQDMRNIALEYGIQDATLVGEAMYQALSAGRDYQSLMDGFMDENLQISKAGFVDPLGAVDLTTTIMNTYQLKDMNGIGDALLATQDRGKTTVDEVTQYYSKQFGAFRSIGVGYKDALALLAETTRMGQRTADASTGIGAILSEFSKSDSTVNEYFKELNDTTIPEFLKNGGSIVETISMIKSTLDVLNMSSFDMFGSVEAARTFETMTSDMNGLIETQESVRNSTGKLEEAFDTMSQTTKTALDEAKTAWEDFKIALGEKVAPTVVDWLRDLTSLLNGTAIEDAREHNKNKLVERGLNPEFYAGGGMFPEELREKDYNKKIGQLGTVGERIRSKKNIDYNIEKLIKTSSPEEIDAYINKVTQQHVGYKQQYDAATGEERGRLSAVLDMSTHMLKLFDEYKQNFNTVANVRVNPLMEQGLEQMLTEVSNTTNNESTQTVNVTNHITVTTQQESEVATRVANEIERSTIAYIPKKTMYPALSNFYKGR